MFEQRGNSGDLVLVRVENSGIYTVPGEGFRYKVGNRVDITARGLGTRANDVRKRGDRTPWTIGISVFSCNLIQGRLTRCYRCWFVNFGNAELSMTMITSRKQLARVEQDPGFIAALDQSGGSTPVALRHYGLDEGAWSTDEEMFSIIHAMRTRIVTSPSFTGARILGAILFENTLDREIEGKLSARYLWEEKHVVPFLKVDSGLSQEANGVQVMKQMTGLDDLLLRARENGVFGTKMRSVIRRANTSGIKAVVDQQFAVARQILAAGLIPIIEPEIDIHSPEKANAEALLKEELLIALEELGPGERVMLKLTLPESDNFYAPCVSHPKVLRVTALSGGYTREEANLRLSRNHDVVASFSRALTEGLHVGQSEAVFDAILASSIDSIYIASQNK